MLAQIDSAAGGLDQVDRVVKLTVFVASAPGFTAQPSVADGASRLLLEDALVQITADEPIGLDLPGWLS